MKKRFKKIYIEITNICNLSCDFCAPDNRVKAYMQKEDFIKVLKEIKPYTQYIYLHVKGEPLLHPKINEFIDIAHQQGFYINLTTNGTLRHKLTTKNIRQINYSMQSAANIKEMQEIIQDLKAYIQDTNIYLSLRLWIDKIKGNQDIEQMLKEEFPLFDKIEDKRKLDNNIFLSIENEFVWPDMEQKELSKEGYCYGLKDHIAILVDGTIIPCCLDHKGCISLGNILEDNLEDVLQSPRVSRMIEGFQNRKATEALCQTCAFKNRF